MRRATRRTSSSQRSLRASRACGLLECPRGGKVAAQDRAVRRRPSRGRRVLRRERDLGAGRAAAARREPRRPRRRLRLRAAAARDGGRHEPRGHVLALRDEAARGRVAARLDHRRQRLDLRGQAGRLRRGRPALGPRPLVSRTGWCRHGRRAVYEPAAHAFEKPTPSNETEYRRKVRMFEHCWEITLRGSMFRRLPPGYLVEIVSHRLLRYGSGLLHLALLASSVALVADGWVVRDRARRPGGADRARPPPASRSRATTCSSRGRRSSRSGTTSAAACPRRGRRRRARGEPRCSTSRSPALGLAVTSPLLAARALAIKLEDGGPVLYRQTRVGKDGEDFELLKLRTMVVGAEKKGAGLRGRRGRQPHHARRAAPAPDLARRAAAALERRARRDEPDRAAADAALPGREVHRAPAPAARRAAGAHRLGAGPRPRDAAVGRADRARRLVRRAPLAARRPRDPAADAARALRRHVPGRDAAAGERREARPVAVPRAAATLCRRDRRSLHLRRPARRHRDRVRPRRRDDDRRRPRPARAGALPRRSTWRSSRGSTTPATSRRSRRSSPSTTSGSSCR